MNEQQRYTQLGLRAAATYLEEEADRVLRQRAGQAVLMTAEELAGLLRTAAEDVRRLRVTPGR